MSDPVSWDAGLIRRYGQVGPLYTAYPALAQYCNGIYPSDLSAALNESSRLGRPLSLYVHIPFCVSACTDCFRARFITTDHIHVQRYMMALHREIDLLGTELSAVPWVERLHLGGGTPSFFSPHDLNKLMSKLRSAFNLHEDDNGDYSVDIDPREADWPTLGLLRELGFNHISLRVQGLAPEVQQADNRLQSLEQTQSMVDASRALAYRSVSLDLVYGLPHQTESSFADTLQRVIAMKPDRIALRNYSLLPELCFSQRQIKTEELPNHDVRLAIYGSSQQQLLAAGYRFIGMGQFALPDDQLSLAREMGMLYRDLQGYVSGRECDLIGLGVSAISQVGDLCCRNTCDLVEYQQALQQGRLPLRQGHARTADDRLRWAIIQQLMCQWRLNYLDIERRFNINFVSYFADCFSMLRRMHQDGLIRLSPGSLEVLPAGRALIARICMVFDAYQSINPDRA